MTDLNFRKIMVTIILIFVVSAGLLYRNEVVPSLKVGDCFGWSNDEPWNITYSRVEEIGRRHYRISNYSSRFGWMSSSVDISFSNSLIKKVECPK